MAEKESPRPQTGGQNSDPATSVPAGHDDRPGPRFLDLGNGEGACFGTAADMAAAAEYLASSYPDGPSGERAGPVHGSILNMGTELRRMIRDGAPPSWTPLMRLVASEIADDARDPSQGVPDEDWPWSALPVEGRPRRGQWRDGLTERCGVTARAISDALTSLARTGYEMRQQIGTDKRGRPVFAARGHAMRFQVPPLQPRSAPGEPQSAHGSAAIHGALTEDSSSHPGATFPDESPHPGATYNGERSHQDVSKVAPGCDPIPSESPHELQSPQEDQSPHPPAGASGRARDVDRNGDGISQNRDSQRPDTRTRNQLVPKRDVPRLAEADDPEIAVKGLVDKGWWEDRGDAWFIGLRFSEWQRDKEQVENRRAYLAEAQRRRRKHKAGDHSSCLPSTCKNAPSTVVSTVESTDPPQVGSGRVGSGKTLPVPTAAGRPAPTDPPAAAHELPPCPHGMPGGALANGSGVFRCPQCRLAALPSGAWPTADAAP